MGQLIKLQDYISRYEQDIYRYPLQFVRLKQQQWGKLKTAFLAGELETLYGNHPEEIQVQNEQEGKLGIGTKLKKMFSRQVKSEVIELESLPVMERKEFSFHFSSTPNNLEELKQTYLNQLIRFQLKWGSSTIQEKSYINQTFFLDEKLRFFLQRFPDTCLILYKPIFLLKNAPVEGEVIIVTPTEVWCIAFLEDSDDAAFMGSSDRFWLRKHHLHSDKKVLNPMLSVNRMGKIVKRIGSIYESPLPIHKVVLSRNGYIDYPQSPYDIEIVDKRSFPAWFKKMRSAGSPLKHQQLKTAQALLDYCQTTSSSRVEWENEIDGETEDDYRT